jgi:hypothetical protein
METEDKPAAGARMRVFRLNDYEWYAAYSLEEAIRLAMSNSGLSREEAADEDAAELTDAELGRLKFTDEDGTKRSFREQLALEIAAGSAPGPFATTEA